MIGKTTSQSQTVCGSGQSIDGTGHTRTEEGSFKRKHPQASTGRAAGKARWTVLRAGCSILCVAFLGFTGAVSELGAGDSLPPPKPARAQTTSRMVGTASWYGYPYHGRKAADGKRYDMNRMTAAHRTLPLGTRVRVHNLRNARIVEVRITDRGPYVEGRIIDLSRAAAQALGFRREGLAPVWLEILSETDKTAVSD
jgi:rare lipoprotein A